MDFRVLGPLEVLQGARPVDLGRPKQRALLGLLLLRAGHAVSVDRLMEELWRGRPPRQAAASLHAYVSNLRRAVEPPRRAGEPPRVLVRRAGGYVVHVEPGCLDVARFEGGVARARAAARQGQHETARRLFESALSEWRGAPLADLSDELDPIPEIPRLVELRLSALEDALATALELGRHAEVVADLEALVREHPLRERLRGHLALALYRTGRQADALARLRDGRRLLADELGLTASPALRDLEQLILQHAPEVGWREERPRVREARPASSAGATELVGREEPLAVLSQAWTETSEGRGRVVLVTGEAGVGKTALAESFVAAVTAGGGRALRGRSLEDDGMPPFWPWLQILEALVDGLDDDALRAATGAEGPELARLLASVADRLGVQPPPVADATEARFRLSDAVTRFLLRATSHSPLAVVLDDVHVADAPSLDLLRFIAAHVRNAPLLIVATFRDGDADRPPALAHTLARLGREAPVTRVPLAGLSVDDVSVLLERHLGAPPEADAVRALHERTDGNPFFLSELLHAAGTDRAAWDATPAGVREVIERRLLDLPAPVVETLETAAVIGREFDVATAAAARGRTPAELLDSLDDAVAAQLVVEQDDAAFSYRFRHALVRETLWRRLAPSRRARLHARVGEAIERSPGPSRSAEVARHYTHAAALGYADRAVEAALAASAEARAVLAFEESEQHLRRALAVLERHGDRDGRELVVQARLTALLLETKGYSAPALGAAAARVRALAPHAGALPEVAGVLWALWSYRTVRAEFPAALAIADELAEATAVAPRDVVRAASLHARGVTLWHVGGLQASVEALEAAVGAVDRVAPDDLARAGLGHLPICARLHMSHPLVLLDRAEEAERHVLAAVALSDAERDPYNHALALLFVGWLAVLRSDAPAAIPWLENASRLCDEYGFRQLAAITGAPLGWAQATSGDPVLGVATIEASMAAMLATGARMLRHWQFGLLAEALLAAGRPDDALGAVQRGLRTSEDTGEVFHQPELLRLRALLMGERGARDAAVADLEVAAATAERQGAALLVRRVQAALGAA